MPKAISESYNDAYSNLKELGYIPFIKSAKPPLLEEVLQQRFLDCKSFIYRGKEYSFSTYSTERAFSKLKHAVAASYNEIYGLLRNGLTTRETVESDTIVSTIQYIDWENVSNNQFHIIREYPCQIGAQKIVLDMVLFVNGIPLVILDFSLLGSIALFQKFQLLNNELKTGNTPISFAQLLISVSPERVEYNTTNAPDKQWPVWNEGSGDDVEHKRDRILTSLCAPDNLLRLIKSYILVGKDNKKIARFHQKRAVEAAIEQIKTYQPNGSRKGGTILHTVGSGISITRILLIQNIMQQPDILKPRILVVTDRIELNHQIQEGLSQYGQSATQATSVKHLMKLLEDDSLIITTVINKFHQISIDAIDINDTIELFILIDTSLGNHSNTYFNNLHQLFPKACYIEFAGKPFQTGKGIYEREHLIDLYSLEDTIENDVTVPIFYLKSKVSVEKIFWDTEFDGPWKRARQSSDETAVDIIADHIASHFCKHNKGTPFKAILVTASRPIAQKYKDYFDRLPDGPNHINTALLVSKDDKDIDAGIDSFTREGKNEVEYNKGIIQKLQSPSNELEILIICKQQLTGIDTSLINTLYIAKYMQSNQLTQYISRINRKAKNKFSCLVVDYVDIQQPLEEVVDAWHKLSLINNKRQKPYSRHHQIRRLTNRINMLDRLREYLEKPVTGLNTLHTLIPKKEMEELYLANINECDAILLTIKQGSEKLKQETDKKHFKKRLNTHKNFLEEIKSNNDIQPTASPLDPNVAPILQNDQLAILLYKQLKDILIKKRAAITDEKTASACMLWTNSIRAMFVRDRSSKAIRDMTNFLEDSLLSFCNKNNTDISFSEIDYLIDAFHKILENII